MRAKKADKPGAGAKPASSCKHRVFERRGEKFICHSCGADVTKMAKKLKPAGERDEPFLPDGG